MLNTLADILPRVSWGLQQRRDLRDVAPGRAGAINLRRRAEARPYPYTTTRPAGAPLTLTAPASSGYLGVSGSDKNHWSGKPSRRAHKADGLAAKGGKCFNSVGNIVALRPGSNYIPVFSCTSLQICILYGLSLAMIRLGDCPLLSPKQELGLVWRHRAVANATSSQANVQIAYTLDRSV